jgi:hypothetical protein
VVSSDVVVVVKCAMQDAFVGRVSCLTSAVGLLSRGW